jgi:putative SOS response-associated peptidase YedK
VTEHTTGRTRSSDVRSEKKRPLLSHHHDRNERVRPHHDRMPAILAPNDYAKWFDHETQLKELHALLKPYPAELMAESAANVLVNSAKKEGPRLLDPAA